MMIILLNMDKINAGIKNRREKVLNTQQLEILMNEDIAVYCQTMQLLSKLLSKADISSKNPTLLRRIYGFYLWLSLAPMTQGNASKHP